MPDDLLIELNAPAYARLRTMMAFYGDSAPETMISRALGLLEMLEPYVGPDGVLTVVNPNPERNGEGAEVDLVFDNMSDRAGRPSAAASPPT